jgi:hypothetical protein
VRPTVHLTRLLVTISLLVLSACGSFAARLSTATTDTDVAARANTAGACEAFPFDRTYTYQELTSGQGKELGENVKVCEFQWEIDPVLNTLGGEAGCDAPTGSVVFTSLTLEYKTDDGTLQQSSVGCPITKLTFDSQQTLQDVVSGCFKSLTAQLGDQVIKALSTKAKKVRIFASSACTDGCFSADWTVTTVVQGGLIVIGDCPK